MQRTAEECVTTSLDTAKTFHPCYHKGENVIQFEEKDVTDYVNLLKQANVERGKVSQDKHEYARQLSHFPLIFLIKI